MTEWPRPDVMVGSLRLIGTYWFQLLPGEEASVTFGPEGERVVIRLEDFDADGDPDVKIDLENEKDLVIHLLRMKKVRQWGTSQPSPLGTVGEQEVFVSLIAEPFAPSVLIHLALYVSPALQEGARREDATDTGQTDK